MITSFLNQTYTRKMRLYHYNRVTKNVFSFYFLFIPLRHLQKRTFSYIMNNEREIIEILDEEIYDANKDTQNIKVSFKKSFVKS